MSDTTNGAEEILGLNFLCVHVGQPEVEIKLCQLTYRQQISLAKETFDTQLEANLAEYHAAAQRGGYHGSRDDLADLLVGDDHIRLDEAMRKLHPLTYARIAAMTNNSRQAPVKPAE